MKIPVHLSDGGMRYAVVSQARRPPLLCQRVEGRNVFFVYDQKFEIYRETLPMVTALVDEQK